MKDARQSVPSFEHDTKHCKKAAKLLAQVESLAYFKTTLLKERSFKKAVSIQVDSVESIVQYVVEMQRK